MLGKNLKIKISEQGLATIYVNNEVLIDNLLLSIVREGRHIVLGEDIAPKEIKRSEGEDEVGYYNEVRIMFAINSEEIVNSIFKTYKLKEGNVLYVWAEYKNARPCDSYETGHFELSLPNLEKVLAYHFSFDPPDYRKAFAYYNPLGKGEQPKASPPPLTPYPPSPPKEQSEIRSTCWSYPLILNNIKELEGYDKIHFLLIKRSSNLNIAILPLSAYGQRAIIRSKGDRLYTLFQSFLKTFSPQHLPGFIVAISDNPYNAVSLAFRVGFSLLGRRHYLRDTKPYPTPFKYLGWCSWNAYLRDINEKSLLEALEEFKKKKIPVKMFIIDDGWHTTEDSKLMDFEANKAKFPKGLGHVVKKLKEGGILHVGAWITLQGYWRGIHEKSHIAKRYPMLLGGINKQLIPDPRELKGLGFYIDFYNFLKKSGIDFTKVDNQYDVVRYAADVAPITEIADKLHRMLESAAGLFAMPILDCMAMTPDCFFYWSASNIARTSIDYIPYWKDGAKKHLLICAYNALWLSQVAWPDWDMFQSHDPYALVHAVARAISGGPIYITDRPKDSRADIIKKLAFKDGTLPTLVMPALPTLDVIFTDPYNNDCPLKLFNQVEVPGWGLIGLIAAFNITAKGNILKVRVSPKEALLKDGRTYIVYEYFSQKLEKVPLNELSSPLELEELRAALFIISPIKVWFAPLGLLDIFIMPSAIKWIEMDEDKTNILLRQEGTFTAFVEGDVEVYIGGKKAKEVSEELRDDSYILRDDGLLKVKSTSKFLKIVRK